MPNRYTAVTKKNGDRWIGWIEEIPGVRCQEKTRRELLKTLRITLKEALENHEAHCAPADEILRAFCQEKCGTPSSGGVEQ